LRCAFNQMRGRGGEQVVERAVHRAEAETHNDLLSNGSETGAMLGVPGPGDTTRHPPPDGVRRTPAPRFAPSPRRVARDAPGPPPQPARWAAPSGPPEVASLTPRGPAEPAGRRRTVAPGGLIRPRSAPGPRRSA